MIQLKNNKTPELCLSAVQRNLWALQYVPDRFRTSEFYLAVVQQNGWALYYVPEAFITPELCLAAVQEEGGALHVVPEEFRTLELCLAAVQKNGRALEYVPEEFRTAELCLAAVQQYGRALRDVPEEFRTPELCLVAVEQNGGALHYVPEPFKTFELCLAAVEQNGGALHYVPEDFRTPELCFAAVKQEGGALEYVPEAFRTPALCLAAVEQCGRALEYVPEVLKTPELCLAAVQQYGRALEYVPEAFRTPELYLAAVQQNAWVLQLVAEAFRTPELCLAAVEQYGWTLEYVAEAFRTPELCLAAVEQYAGALEYVPEELKTSELCVAAQSSIEALVFMPAAFKTPEIIRAAFQKNSLNKKGYQSDRIKMEVFSDRERMEKTGTADFDAAAEAAFEVYRLANLEKPSVILRMGSPYGAMLGITLAMMFLNDEKIFQKMQSFMQPDSEKTLPNISELFMKNIMDHVKNQAGERLACDPEWHFGPWWYLFRVVSTNPDWRVVEIDYRLWRDFMDRMDDQEAKRFGAQVLDQVKSQIMQHAENLMEAPSHDYPEERVLNFTQPDSGNRPWVDWRSFVSFFRDLGDEKHEIYTRFDIDEALAWSCGDIWWHENVLAISDRPKEIHRDAEGRLHNVTGGPAITYRDGWSLYYWHGVPIPGAWVTGNPPSAGEALTWENVEQRRAACEIIGWKRILEELDAKVIDEDDDPEIGTLLEADIPGSGKERFLKVRCGTGREFVLPVPRHVNTALEANAWTWDIEDYEYRPEVRT